ncbi:MAG: rhomboid family intramembrane serine protease [Chitinophagaceae bacterium]|nr:rhomboid family intramembrane serine protease [Chitinophagaceae bacterium]
MGEADRYIDYKDKGSYKKAKRFTLGDSNNAVMAIIAINIIMFLFIMITRLFYLFTHQGQGMEVLQFDAINWFALPANLVSLSEKPWTILTFMFAHGGLPTFSLLLTMLGNMLWLWAFAYMLQDLSGNKLIFPVYIYGALAGAVFFIIACYTIPSLKSSMPSLFLTGSATGTTAIAIAVTTMAPNYKMFRHIGNGISVWILTILYLVITFMSAVMFNNANSIAILGSAFAGFLFVYFLQKGKDGSVWMLNFYHWCGNLFTPAKSNNISAKEKIFYNTGNRTPFEKKTTITQQRVDELLDKISQKGYHFLTNEEKEFLKKASEED